MAIEFTCSSCNTTLRVPDEHAGKQARCPKCQSLNLIQASNRQYDPVAGQPFTSQDAPGQLPMGKPIANPYAASQGSTLPAGGVAGHAYQSAHRGSMILTLGIISLFCNFFAIPGIMAWVMGRADMRQMDAGRMDPEGKGLTQAGMIMGIIMTIFAIIGLVFFVIYMVFVFIVVIGAAANA